MQSTNTFDLRPLAPAQRHSLAVQVFETLGMGQAFELINDHEPRSLLMQFQQLFGQSFEWQVMAADPGAWRIRISRVAAGAAPAGGQGCCSCSCSA